MLSGFVPVPALPTVVEGLIFHFVLETWGVLLNTVNPCLTTVSYSMDSDPLGVSFQVLGVAWYIKMLSAH